MHFYIGIINRKKHPGDTMRRSAFLCILCLMLCACSGTKQTAQTGGSGLDTASVQQNTEAIKQILDQNVCIYDNDSFIFSGDIVISPADENFAAICEASRRAGIDTTRLENGEEQTMLASVRLLNPDMSDAGTAYFVFSDKTMLCGYYMYNDACYSLNNKYPFEYLRPFVSSENKDTKSGFTNASKNVTFERAADISNGEMAVISGSSLVFYGVARGNINRKSINDFDDYLIPADASVGKKCTAVLLDSYRVAENTSDYEYVDEQDELYVDLKSERIDFINAGGDYVYPSLELDLSIYTSAAFVDEHTVAVARNKAIDIFAFDADTAQWTKTQRCSIDCSPEKLRVTDIDNDGSDEYVVSDGVNIFVYKYDQRLKQAWSTKFAVSAVTDFFAADLNGDGIKEIYINDSNGFVSRYILADNGFEIYGGGITAGDSRYYAAGDINDDGKDDYITVGTDDDAEKLTLYLQN